MRLLNTHYSQWVWTNSNNSDYPAYSMPLNDNERYEKMSSSVPKVLVQSILKKDTR